MRITEELHNRINSAGTKDGVNAIISEVNDAKKVDLLLDEEDPEKIIGGSLNLDDRKTGNSDFSKPDINHKKRRLM